METMSKICPSCGKKLPASAGFCAGCGTNLQGVAPVQNGPDFNQIKAVATDVAGSVVSTVKTATKGIAFTYFIPAVVTVINILGVLVSDWFKIKTDYDRETFKFSELMEVISEEIEFFAFIIIGLLVIGFILSIAGSVLTILKKTAGKVLFFVGSALALLDVIGLSVIFLIMDIEYSDVVVEPKAGPILFFIFTIVGIVFAAVSKTGNKLNQKTAPMNQQFNPVQVQVNYPTQNQNPNDYNNQFNNYNNNQF